MFSSEKVRPNQNINKEKEQKDMKSDTLQKKMFCGGNNVFDLGKNQEKKKRKLPEGKVSILYVN